MDLGKFLTLKKTFGWDEDRGADFGRFFLRFRCSICPREVSLEEGKANSNRLGQKRTKRKDSLLFSTVPRKSKFYLSYYHYSKFICHPCTCGNEGYIYQVYSAFCDLQ